jgi:inner membrane protein
LPTIISHGIAAVALGKAFQRSHLPRRFWVAGVVCAIVPDLDVIGFGFGIPYGGMFGHRGLSHSLAFAIVLGTLTTMSVFPKGLPDMSRSRIWLCLSMAAASHGVLDAFTNGGLGVALLAPFDASRYFFPWRPIRVSPLGLTWLFSRRGAAVFASEAVWVWVPCAAVAVAGHLWWRHSLVAGSTGSAA